MRKLQGIKAKGIKTVVVFTGENSGLTKGELMSAFAKATAQETLRVLQKAFRAANPAAIQILDKFQQAARRLRISENAFNIRARRSTNSKPSIMKHLRSSAELKAVREFHQAKDLLDGAGPLGREIVRRTKDFSTAAIRRVVSAPAPR